MRPILYVSTALFSLSVYETGVSPLPGDIDVYIDPLRSPNILIQYDASLKVYRPYDKKAGIWLVNSRGHFPYFRDGTSGGDTPAQDAGRWVQQTLVDLNKVNLVSQSVLKDYADHYGGSVTKGVNYYYVTRIKNAPKEILVDSDNRPYAAIIESSSTASGTENNYYVEIDNSIHDDSSTIVDITDNTTTTVFQGGDTTNNQIINVDGNYIWLPDGTMQYIDSLTYDESTHTYYVDSHDSYTWNYDNREYTTNYYNYEIQYHINYTSVTCIGQRAEYDKRYKCCYELPDGRGSAGLTAEGLEQLSVVFRAAFGRIASCPAQSFILRAAPAAPAGRRLLPLDRPCPSAPA